MATHNDITGDALISKQSNDNYRNNYDRIFGKKKGNDNAGQHTVETADGSAVSVSGVSSAAECTGVQPVEAAQGGEDAGAEGGAS